MAKVHIETYGCTLNQADSDIISALLGGTHELIPSEAGADIIIINTCTVKGATESKILERIRRLVAGGQKLVIAGCMIADRPRLRRAAPYAPLVAPSALRRISEAVEDALSGRTTEYLGQEGKDGLPKAFGGVIARIPINEGCTSNCHFCQTRIARPYLRSYSPKTVAKWMDDAILAGAKEIQLTSQDSGAYGLDIRTDLAHLLRAIAEDDHADKQDASFLVRLGMINPNHAKRQLPALIGALKHERFYKFLHLPVQSGSDKVCREMNRDHSVRDFEDIVSALRKEIPDATISTDIIVGYPTETEDDFQQTLELLSRVKPDIANVSKFSPRPGTAAKAMKQLPNKVVKERSAITAALVKRIGAERRAAFVGRTARVLITEKQRDFTGRDIFYHQIVAKGFTGRLGQSVEIEITSAMHGSLIGKSLMATLGDDAPSR